MDVGAVGLADVVSEPLPAVLVELGEVSLVEWYESAKTKQLARLQAAKASNH